MKESPYAEEYEKLLIWEYFGFATEGYFVEVGAHHPKRLSQTWLLEKVGWKGILIEPLPEYCSLLRRERPSSVVCQVAVSAPGKTGAADFFVSSDLSTTSTCWAKGTNWCAEPASTTGTSPGRNLFTSRRRRG